MKFVRGMVAVLAAVAFIGNVAVAKEVVKEAAKAAPAPKAFCEKEGKQVKAKDKAACEHLGGLWKEPAAPEAAAAPAAAPAPAVEKKPEAKK